jgi:hypothetical protein
MTREPRLDQIECTRFVNQGSTVFVVKKSAEENCVLLSVGFTADRPHISVLASPGELMNVLADLRYAVALIRDKT